MEKTKYQKITDLNSLVFTIQVISQYFLIRSEAIVTVESLWPIQINIAYRRPLEISSVYIEISGIIGYCCEKFGDPVEIRTAYIPYKNLPTLSDCITTLRFEYGFINKIYADWQKGCIQNIAGFTENLYNGNLDKVAAFLREKFTKNVLQGNMPVIVTNFIEKHEN